MPIELRKGVELNERYVISDLVGQGGFAQVWRATDKVESRDVALKRLLKVRGDELENLLEEARKVSRLRGHRNIVEMHEVLRQDDEAFLVMEYVDGDTLEAIVRKHILQNTWFEKDEAIDYFRQILDGLLFAHSSGVYHRDIKPSNILVSRLGVVKVVDFGLAKTMLHVERAPEDGHRGFPWTGTPNFMSPEQATGDHLDHLTDIFSAGIVGCILLTGRHPFNHPSGVASVVDLIKDRGFDPPDFKPGQHSNLTAGGARALARMLCKEKSARCQSLLEPLNSLTKDSEQTCPRCSASNPLGNSFCGQCGSSLRVPVLAPQAVAPTVLLTAEQLTDQGFELTKAGDWSGAITKYEQAIERDRRYARVYSNLGYALNRIGNYERAIDILSAGIQITQDDVLLHRLYDARGFAYSNLKDFSSAVDDFTRAIKLNANNPRVYHHRAEASAQDGELDAALEDTNIALSIDPDYQPALRLKRRIEAQGATT